MGADAVVVYFGVQYVVPLGSKTEIDGLERGTDTRLLNAKKAGLQTWWGRITDGQPYHLLIGRELGILGLENDEQKEIGAPALMKILEEIPKRLAAGGFKETPGLHLLLEAQY